MSFWSWGPIQLAHSFYHLISPSLTTRTFPKVPRVDCNSCRRVREGTALFNVRCCDVTPQFPNFLVGEILEEGGHPVLEKWIAERRGDPYTLLVPPSIAEQHLNARQDGLFGQACPLLSEQEGMCSLYAHRPALCIGYHCYYPNVFWKEAVTCLTSYLHVLQDAASRYFVSISSLDLLQIASIWDDLEDEASIWSGTSQREDVYLQTWQSWNQKESLFYRSCYQRLCEDPFDVRRSIRMLQKVQLQTRLALLSTSNPQRMEEIEQMDLEDCTGTSLEPSIELRTAWQKGHSIPLSLTLTLVEYEQILCWYIERLSVPTLWDSIVSWLRSDVQGGQLEEGE